MTTTGDPPPFDAQLTDALNLLASDNDTNKFVALSLLPKLLQQNHKIDASTLARIFEAAPLEKLLSSSDQDKRSLGCFVLVKTFTNERKRVLSLTRKLADGIARYGDDDIYDTLLFILSKDEIYFNTFAARYIKHLLPDKLSSLAPFNDKLYQLMALYSPNLSLLVSFLPYAAKCCLEKKSSIKSFLNFLEVPILTFDSAVFASAPSFNYPRSMYSLLQSATLSHSHPSSKISLILSPLLRSTENSYFFEPSSVHTSEDKASAKRFVMLRITLSCTNIRSSLLNFSFDDSSKSTQKIALAADYDILATTIQYLGQLYESIEVGYTEKSLLTFDDLLALQKHMKEVFEETIDFLKDQELQKVDIQDPLILSSVNALSLWLYEDDDLRLHASGLYKLFIEVHKAGGDTSLGLEAIRDDVDEASQDIIDGIISKLKLVNT